MPRSRTASAGLRAAGLLLALTACATGDGGHLAAAERPAGTRAAARPAGGDPTGLTSFRSAGAEVACRLSGQEARCDVADPRFVPPRRPADCRLAFGSAVVVGVRGTSFACHVDTAVDPGATVLAPGDRLTNSLFTCTGLPGGAACATATGTHGFVVDRDGYRLH